MEIFFLLLIFFSEEFFDDVDGDDEADEAFLFSPFLFDELVDVDDVFELDEDEKFFFC